MFRPSVLYCCTTYQFSLKEGQNEVELIKLDVTGGKIGLVSERDVDLLSNCGLTCGTHFDQALAAFCASGQRV